MKDYIINDCHVCMNPDILLEYNDPGKVIFRIKGMEHNDGLWSVGHYLDINVMEQGSISPVSCRYNIATKAKCVESEVKWFKWHMERLRQSVEKGEYSCRTGGITALTKSIRWAETQLGPKQLEFNF